MFTIVKKSKNSHARTGILKTKHGEINTPFFMPIATKGAVKSLTADDIRRLKAQIILSNTYHQLLRPGLSILKKAKGLHKFMDWQGPMLTDSGGFQVFSLAKIRKILPHGVKFRSHIDGKEFLLTPKKALEVQEVIGSDIRMVLDVCAPYPCARKAALDALIKTSAWARESKEFESKKKKHLIFAIVQGSVYEDLRKQSAKELVELDFDGYAIGGLAVGESGKEMMKVLSYTVPELPEKKPHYLMGVGYPEQIVQSVTLGIDMFDCVIPTREARHGKLYFWKNRNKLSGKFYSAEAITKKKFTKDLSPINKVSKLPELKNYTKAYLHHLFKTQEPLGIRLATLNNVEFYLELMNSIRREIKAGTI
jgi:queuine tRNA-ribosyltransferase